MPKKIPVEITLGAADDPHADANADWIMDKGRRKEEMAILDKLLEEWREKHGEEETEES